jgi:hypothetical protein
LYWFGFLFDSSAGNLQKSPTWLTTNHILHQTEKCWR